MSTFMHPVGKFLLQWIKKISAEQSHMLQSQIHQRQTHGWKQPRRGPPAAYRNPPKP